MKYREHFDKILVFTNTYNELINCHLVDFITEDLWDRCLPKLLRLELEQNEIGFHNFLKNDSHPELNRFTSQASSLTLESCSMVKDLKDAMDTILDNSKEKILIEDNNKDIKAEFMNVKKYHEVMVLGSVIAAIAESAQSLVIDAGAGKAYLSTYLAENHKLPVLAIDSSKLCHKGAISRHEKLKRKKRQSRSLVRYVVEEINVETDYMKIIKEKFPESNTNKNCIITGLHTCGSLAHSVIRAFLSTEKISCLCLIPCCYHLTNETFNKNYTFSKNARMLAQQSIERSAENKSVPPSLFHRAVLQVILHSMGLYEVRVGRGGPSRDFPSYARWALERIGVESEKIPSVQSLESTYRSYAYLKSRFDMFQMLRINMAPVLEAAIMLDRIIFLEDSKRCSKLIVARLFDPLLSPRRHAIIAMK